MFFNRTYNAGQSFGGFRINAAAWVIKGVINMMTSYFQALGKAVKSLTITVLRNAVLFIPGVILLNHIWKLNGVIAAQPVVETALAIICMAMYVRDRETAR